MNLQYFFLHAKNNLKKGWDFIVKIYYYLRRKHDKIIANAQRQMLINECLINLCTFNFLFGIILYKIYFNFIKLLLIKNFFQ